MNEAKEDWISTFPKQVDNFQGYRIAAVVFLLVTLVTIARSCIHILAPDGGAGSIAGIDRIEAPRGAASGSGAPSQRPLKGQRDAYGQPYRDED